MNIVSKPIAVTAGWNEAVAEEAERGRSASWALAGLSLSMLLSSLGTSIANVALPTFATAFSASFQQVQWIVLAYLLAMTTLIVSVGRLGDVTGRRRLLLSGIILFTLASALCAVAPTLWLLVAARAAQGLGASVMTALTMSLVAETVPKQRTGSAMGLLGTMSAVGTALGPSLGGVLIAGFGWRAIFFVNLPLGLAAGLLVWRHLRADGPRAEEQRARFDHAGTLLLALTLAAYALAMTIGRGRFSAVNAVLLIAAGVGGALFALAEKNAASPLIRFEIFRNRVLSAGFAMSSLVTTVVMATLVVGPFYLSGALALDPARIGLVMACGPVVSALAGVPAGRIVDRFGTRRMIIAALLAMATGAFGLALMPASFGVAGYVVPLVVTTAGYALFQAANNTAVMSDLRSDERGVVSGMLNLSRNLGLITGASVMGAVFALGAGARDLAAADPHAVAAGMRATFAVAAALVMAGLAIAMTTNRSRRAIAISVAVLVMAGVAPARSASAQPRGEGSETRATGAPAPADPYPLAAAGWGPEAGNGLFFSRWAEDWSAARAAGTAPALKAVPLGRGASLTLSGEARIRYDAHDNRRLASGDDLGQGLLRGVLGADLRFNRNVRVYGEIGTGRVEGHRGEAAANFQNDAALQQLFVDVRGYAGSTLVGAMAGRQEFADGPRQLISLSDGPNIHRTWNGVRLYAHGRRVRVGAFDLRATRLESGFFDEGIRRGERLQGVNGSVVLSTAGGAQTYLDPFWLRTRNPAFRVGAASGLDVRDTFGARLWGRRGRLKFDWTLAHQTADSIGRDVDAWGVFVVHHVALAGDRWKPRFTARVDVASREFNQLYASSGYLGEGQFLSLRNLVVIAPGFAVSPAPRMNLGVEYSLARRLTERAPAHAGGMRAYPGTHDVQGRGIGGILRIVASWSVSEHVTWFFNHEHLSAGEVLDRAQLPSGSYTHAGATLRY